ncbi:MAG: hypothetical protein JKY52_01095 [Flavobacteriales bacterium]|nr:hypothetical protein [Flavobacteriales bacterium]
MRNVILIGIAVLGISCSKKANPTSEAKPVKPENTLVQDYARENFVAVTVVDMRELDGCGFMLQLANGKKLQPTPALTQEFSVNDMSVWIKYQVKKGAAGICMSGQIVTLIDIQKQ